MSGEIWDGHSVDCKYRLGVERDIEMLAEMRWQHENEEEGPFEMSKSDFMNRCGVFLKEGLKAGEWTYWIAEHEGIIISNIFVRTIKKVPRPQEMVSQIGYVTNVYTRAEYRNKGIGSNLLEKVKSWATDNDIELLFVWPSEQAVGFYERQGFKNRNEIMELILTCK